MFRIGDSELNLHFPLLQGRGPYQMVTFLGSENVTRIVTSRGYYHGIISFTLDNPGWGPGSRFPYTWSTYLAGAKVNKHHAVFFWIIHGGCKS